MHRKNTVKNCRLFLNKFEIQFGNREIESVTSDESLQKDSVRLKEYIPQKGLESTQQIFPICYAAAREMASKSGKLADVDLKPHDLRRHAATCASKSGAPLEIVSKIILRHANQSTTQIYLGKVSDTEAMRWIENIYRITYLDINDSTSYF